MLKNLKVSFTKELCIKEHATLVLRGFNQRDSRLFYIDEYFDNSNEETIGGCHTAVELIKEDQHYIAKPVYIYNDEDDEIIKVVPLEEAFEDKKVYFTYWKDLMRNFIGEITDYVEYDVELLLELLKDLIENYPNQTYYYSYGNHNGFSFEVLDQFVFKGELTSGMSDENVVISNIKLIDRYSEAVIKELHWVQIEGTIDPGDEFTDIEDIYCGLLISMTKEDMKGYILEAMAKSK